MHNGRLTSDMVPNTDSDFLFHYPASLGGDSACRVRICRRRETVIVLLSELADNPGMSITNASERIASGLCRGQGLDPARVIWIEHYPDRDFEDGVPQMLESFDLITYEWDWDGLEAKHPDWNRIDAACARSLIGKAQAPS